MAVYGWTRWATPVRRQPGWWPWRAHVAAVLASVGGGLLLAEIAGSQLASAWPRLDALTTVASLVATWLTARMRIESWMYWIVIDLVLAWLYARQGLVATAGLFLVYVGVCIAGLVSWTRQYRSNVSPA
jgi:nicotinamide mononucleotide transporter